MALVCTILIILVYLHVENQRHQNFLTHLFSFDCVRSLNLTRSLSSDVIAGMLLSYSWINFSFQIVQRYLPAPEPEEAEVPTQRRRRHSRKEKVYSWSSV